MATLTLPTPPSGSLQQYLQQLNQALIRAFLPLVSQADAVSNVILVAPGGAKWKVTVADDGTLTTAAI